MIHCKYYSPCVLPHVYMQLCRVCSWAWNGWILGLVHVKPALVDTGKWFPKAVLLAYAVAPWERAVAPRSLLRGAISLLNYSSWRACRHVSWSKFAFPWWLIRTSYSSWKKKRISARRFSSLTLLRPFVSFSLPVVGNLFCLRSLSFISMCIANFGCIVVSLLFEEWLLGKVIDFNVGHLINIFLYIYFIISCWRNIFSTPMISSNLLFSRCLVFLTLQTSI